MKNRFDPTLIPAFATHRERLAFRVGVLTATLELDADGQIALPGIYREAMTNERDSALDLLLEETP